MGISNETAHAEVKSDQVLLPGDDFVIKTISKKRMKTKYHFVIITLLLFSRITFAQEALTGAYFDEKPPGTMPVVFAPDIISIKDRLENGLTFSPDGQEIYFGTANSDYSKLDIYLTKQNNNTWTSIVTAPFSEGQNCTVPHFSFDGKILLFTAKNEHSVNRYDNNIMMCEQNENGWSDPKILPFPINSKKREGSCSLTKNGTLYFTSNNRSGVRTGGDIYWSTYFKDGSTVVNKIEILSTKEDEDGVYASPDEDFLIFWSWRSGGEGKHDLYISYRKNDGEWSVPKNMGTKINTPHFETRAFLSPDKKYLFFRRLLADRTDSDIYWVDASIINELRRNVK